MSKGDFSARVDSFRRRRDEISDLGRDFNTMAERTESLLQSQNAYCAMSPTNYALR